MRGALIVVEGCDKSGKTTQCKKIVEALRRGRAATATNIQFMTFPDRNTTIGKMLNEYLQNQCELEDHAAHLLFAANRWELVPTMTDALLSGTTLIVDRYSYSGVAYSAAKRNIMHLEWCKHAEVGLLKPDLVLYFTLSAEEAMKRSSSSSAYGERYEETEFQKTVAKNYETLFAAAAAAAATAATAMGGVCSSETKWRKIDASRDVEAIHKELEDIVTETMATAQHKELQRLWQ
jgi:dTMP kinase